MIQADVNYKVKIVAVNDPELWTESQNKFTIAPAMPVITVTGPVGGETF